MTPENLCVKLHPYEVLNQRRMNVITRKHLIEFAAKHPDCRISLETWDRIVKRTDFPSFGDLRKIFPTADLVGIFTVFNIGGNKARLVVAVHYNTQKVYVRHVMTHGEDSRGHRRAA